VCCRRDECPSSGGAEAVDGVRLLQVGRGTRKLFLEQRGRSATKASEIGFADEDAGEDADEVDQEHDGDGVAGVLDVYGTEIEGHHVKGRLGGPLKETGEASGKAVGPEGLHGVEHEAAGASGAEGAHQGDGDGVDDLGIDMERFEERGETGEGDVHQPRIPKDAQGDEHGDHVRKNSQSGGPAFFSAGDEGIEDVGFVFTKYFFMNNAVKDDQEDDGEEDAVAEIAGEPKFSEAVEPGDVEKQQTHERADADHICNDDWVQEADPLTKANEQECSQGSEKRGDDAGQHDIGRVARIEGCSITDDGGGNQGQSRRVEAEKHDLAVGSPAFVRVDFLHAFHGFQAKGGGGIVEAKKIGGEIHGHESIGRMAPGKLGKNSHEKRCQKAREFSESIGIAEQVEKSAEESEITDKGQPQIKNGAPAGGEDSVGGLFALGNLNHAVVIQLIGKFTRLKAGGAIRDDVRVEGWVASLEVGCRGFGNGQRIVLLSINKVTNGIEPS